MEPGKQVLSAFLGCELPAAWVDTAGQAHYPAASPQLLIPGAFNPLHRGHCTLARVAQELVPGRAAFELSIVNVDKPPLSAEEVGRRLRQFVGQAPLWLTRTPTFGEKAGLFPGVVFVVGADTAARILQSRYYDGSEDRMARALNAIRERGCRFLVAGRVDRTAKFIGLDELAVPAAYRDLFQGIPEQAFRMDISSTGLREQGRPETA